MPARSEHRLAFVLGDIFALPGEQAAQILDVTPAAYRKRLSRARERIRAFMEGNCGLVNPANACRCARRIGRAANAGRTDPERPLFATHPRRSETVRTAVVEMERLHTAAAVFRSHPDYQAPAVVGDGIARLLQTARDPLLADPDSSQ